MTLTPMTEGREVVEDYRAVQLSLRAHPLAFLRPELDRRGIVPAGELVGLKDGDKVEVAGIVLVRQRPGKGNVTFITLEDETGIANAIIWQRIFEAQRRIILARRCRRPRHAAARRRGHPHRHRPARGSDASAHQVGAMQFPHLRPADAARRRPDPRRPGSGRKRRTPDVIAPAVRAGSAAEGDQAKPGGGAS